MELYLTNTELPRALRVAVIRGEKRIISIFVPLDIRPTGFVVVITS